jgi:hypothetical protein
MARIRKYKLAWQASESHDVIGYKLYWSRSTDVTYESKFIKVGNVTEILLPDDVILSDGPVMFGVTALDRDGNESDMALIPKPYHLHVPAPPAHLSVEPSDEFKLVDASTRSGDEKANVTRMAPPLSGDDDSLIRAIEGDGHPPPFSSKYNDPVGSRQT